MTPERWEQINQIFHSALDHERGKRAAFIAEACGGDVALLEEVESLVASHEQVESFIEKPAADIAAELLAAGHRTLGAGKKIGHYTIGGLLGAGGMGEVYLAQDLRLGRQIALKLLPAEFTRDKDRVRRLEREARAASALNHPNIVTIHEIGRSNSSHFIATEFIDGQTLRQHMARSQLKSPADPGGVTSGMDIDQIVDIAYQIASALAAAHAAGIVHRDIKPENIMIRRDGFVKVLDFGLAKLALDQLPSTVTEALPASLVTTNPGMLMGTVQYMSPEQASGLDVDARTDIWSLGVVLYEMIMGHAPFEGETPRDVIGSILEKEPSSVLRCSRMPLELARIVRRLLRKRREERYSTASDVAEELKSLRQELAVEARLNRSAAPDSPDRQSSVVTVERTPTESFPLSERSSNTVRFSAEYVTSKIKLYRRALVPILAIVLLVIGVLVGINLLLRQVLRTASVEDTPFESIEFNRLSNTGKIKDAAISLDGKFVAYITEEGGKSSIWIRKLSDSTNLELVPPADIQHYGPTFSQDSSYLYYVVKERNSSIGTLHRIPASGGTPSKLIVDVDGPPSISPDGSKLTFVRGSSSGERALMIANIDGTDERKLASRYGGDGFTFGGPAWSPDGKSIACAAGNTDADGRYMTVLAVDVADGSTRAVTTQKWKSTGRVVWQQNGKGLVLTATNQGRGAPHQLWYISYPSGEARNLTRDLHDYDGVSLSGDSTAIVSKQIQTISGIWIAPNNDSDRAREVLSNKYDGHNDFYNVFSWMPNNQILYTSLIHGAPSIWVMNEQGGRNKQLTPEPSSNSFPSATLDGRHVIFVSDRTRFTTLWRMDADGTNEKQLTNGTDDTWAWCSPDSQWVVYHSLTLGKRTLYRVSINGGEPEQLTDYHSICPAVSPDGKWISCYYRPATKAPWKFAIIPFNGGPPVKTFDVPENVVLQSLMRWTPDGRALAYIKSRGGVSNIWIQPVDGASPQQLTHFKSDQIFWFDWSSDGRQLAVSRGAVTSDVVLIKDLR